MTNKLLLADDSITIQKVIGIIIATEDYQLIVTDNGDDAFEKALQEYPDLVIADISMPGKDGFELCEAIKKDSRLPHTSVLLLPGTFEHFDEARADAVGADGWIHKPFESQAFLDKVAQVLASEPVRLTADSAVFEQPAEAPAVAELSEPEADETTLSLEDMEEPAGLENPLEEESPEDIWDAVSFEEDDLQGQVESSAAADLEAIGGTDFSGAEEQGDEVAAEELASSFDDSPEDIPLELTEEIPVAATLPETEIDFSTEEEAPLELIADEPEYAAEGSAYEDQPLELHDEDIEASEEISASEFGVEDEPLELTEEEPLELTEEEPLELVEEEVASLVEPSDEESVAEEDVLDLADDDVLDEVIEEEYAAQEVEGEPLGLAEEMVVAGEDSTVEEKSVAADETMAEEEPGYAPAYEEVGAEDDGFFFDDASGEEEEVAAAPEPVAAASAPSTSASIEQVEQQLRGLSADELKEVVSKVAGPMIEKLASEMLAQIAWEVVPDLAEAMIREEIRKIKQGAE